jgi:hypothetical protein
MKKLNWDFEDRTANEFVYNPNIYNYDLLIRLYEPKMLDDEMFKSKTSFSKSWYDQIALQSKLELNEGFYVKKKKHTKKELEYAKNFELLVTKTNSFMKKKFIEPSDDYVEENRFLIESMKDVRLEIGDSKILELKEMLDKEEIEANERLWTTFKSYKKLITPTTGAGYSVNQFLAFNQKASNLYRHVKKMAYLVNVYPHPDLVTFFHGNGISINQDQYAISEMIQWIFRSRIRSGKKIELFVPSTRMRGLLKKWMRDIKKLRQDRLEEINTFPTTLIE